MHKESLVRLVKKEYLLFKKERSEKHRLFCDDIKSVLNDEDFYFVDSEVLQAFNFKATHEGVGSSIHDNYNKSVHLELDSAGCKRLSQINAIDHCDEWLCVFPAEWQLCGGLLVSKAGLFSNFLKLSSFMQDDFDVYDGALNSVLICRGDRSGDDLCLFSITAKGDCFSFFTRWISQE